MGQKETSRDPIAMSVKCQKEDILSSLLARCFSLFAIKNSLFRLQGIRPKKSRVSMGLCKRGGAFQRKFPVFSRGSGNFRQRKLVRCSLSAQPPSRAFSGSLPTLAKRSRRSPELRHQLAVFLSDLTPESASQRKNPAFLLVYLYRVFSGVTLAEERMLTTISLGS